MGPQGCQPLPPVFFFFIHSKGLTNGDSVSVDFREGLKGARIELWEQRSDDLPPRGGSDPNTSSDAGHFCVDNVPPGEYFLTAESDYFDDWSRNMAFYPAVAIAVAGFFIFFASSAMAPVPHSHDTAGVTRPDRDPDHSRLGHFVHLGDVAPDARPLVATTGYAAA